MERVQKILSNRGYCSRRQAEEIIQEGRVKVNNKKITIGDKAKETDIITVDNKPIPKIRKIYLMFNKPIGCVTALKDKQYKTVMDYIDIKERIFPVGRLDYNTSGLLILTNDGDFANKITHPSNEIKKTYQVELNRPIQESDLNKLETGVMLDDGKTAPAEIILKKPNLIQITIHEGKNRIVRRMVEALGLNVMKLKRIKIGRLSLGSLPVGRYKKITPKQI